MTNKIHPSSIVEDGAVIGNGVEIGPFCHIGSDVKIADGAMLHSHVVIAGDTHIGSGAKIFPFASIGHEPQDLKHTGEPTKLRIGKNCVIRECVTINTGTAGDIGITTIGDNCVFLASSHVAHDCVVGNNVIFSNNVMLAGHCVVGDYVIIGGGAGVHQFCRIGNNSFVGGMAGLDSDLIPFGMALGNRAYLGGLNIIGMKRAGFERTSIHKSRALVKNLFSGNATVKETAGLVENEFSDDVICKQILEFIDQSGDRSLCTPK